MQAETCSHHQRRFGYAGLEDNNYNLELQAAENVIETDAKSENESILESASSIKCINFENEIIKLSPNTFSNFASITIGDKNTKNSKNIFNSNASNSNIYELSHAETNDQNIGTTLKIHKDYETFRTLRNVKDNTRSRKISSLLLRKKSTGKIRRRLLDEEGFIRRVACLCIKAEGTKVMLVSSKKDPTSFMVPGGGLEENELETEAAVREAWEEAGVRGSTTQHIGLFETFHSSGNKKHRTSVYAFLVTSEEDDFPEAYLGRTRRWFSRDEALIALRKNKPLQCIYIEKFISINN